MKGKTQRFGHLNVVNDTQLKITFHFPLCIETLRTRRPRFSLSVAFFCLAAAQFWTTLLVSNRDTAVHLDASALPSRLVTTAAQQENPETTPAAADESGPPSSRRRRTCNYYLCVCFEPVQHMRLSGPDKGSRVRAAGPRGSRKKHAEGGEGRRHELHAVDLLGSPLRVVWELREGVLSHLRCGGSNRGQDGKRGGVSGGGSEEQRRGSLRLLLLLCVWF